MTSRGNFLIEAARKHAEGSIALHVANIQTYRLNPAGIGEHSDIVETIGKELDNIATHNDRLEMIDKYICPEVNTLKYESD
tara:strand:- start:1305 stop:1547 length:243 start_codon:yes stop_codon:yes gene_type:complete